MLQALHALLVFCLSILRYVIAKCNGFRKKDGEDCISVMDAIWLEMSDENTSVVINAVLHLQDRTTREKITELIENNLRKYKKFRCAIEQPPSYNRFWEAIFGKPRPVLREVDFDDTYHITQQILLGKENHEQSLQQLINELGNERLNYDKPLWRLHIIDSEDETRGSIILMQIHHSIGDGMSLVRLLFSLTTEQADGQTRPSLQLLHGGGKKTTPEYLNKADIKGHTFWDVMHRCLFIVVFSLWAIAQVFKALLKLLLCPPDTRTVLKGPLGPEKQMSYIDLDLDEVKAISKAQNCTINDVLVALVSGSLREYLCTQQESPVDVNTVRIHAVIPFSLRPWKEEIELDNNFGMLFLPLPIDEAKPMARMHRVSQAMHAIKTSLEPYVNYYAIQLLFLGPIRRYLCPLFAHFSDKASLILTNVPGPQQPLYFAGSRLDMLRFFVPQGARLSLGVSIFSYGGKVSIGVSADKKIVKNPELIGRYCREQFQQLKNSLKIEE